jgi:hypothetical protein
MVSRLRWQSGFRPKIRIYRVVSHMPTPCYRFAVTEFRHAANIIGQ